MLVTCKRLLNYQRCQRRVFLDIYGDFSQLDPPNDFLRKLNQDRLVHQQQVMVDQIYEQPIYPKFDFQAGAEATLALMRQGVETIYHGVLLAPGPEGVTLVSYPDLLKKHPGESDFGDWLYSVTDIQLSKRAKQDYQIIVAYHTYILAAIQGAWPENGWLNLREKGLAEVDLWKRLPQMQEILTAYITTLRSEREPEIFISREKCSLCGWLSSCSAIAQSQHHLSLLPGVTPSRYKRLQYLNVTSVASLAHLNPAELEFWQEFENGIAKKVVMQAQSVLENKAIVIDKPQNIAESKLSTNQIELYFDIESQPDLDFIYLHGVLVVDRAANTEIFHPFLAEKIEDEGKIWSDFLNLVWQYPQAPIFHFCDYEVETIKNLAKLYHTPQEKWEPLLKRFVDIHAFVTQTTILPIEGYGLKQIARWLGFEWRDRKANGGQCVFWYDTWLKNGDRSFLAAILSYNEDDCRATYHVKDWLVKFLDQL